MKKEEIKIHIASDHAGFELKKQLISYLSKLKYEVTDHGPDHFDKDDDYPDFIKLVAQEVSRNPQSARGIILGGSGQGEAIVANRFPRVRAVVYYGGSLDIITLSREHNDANILSLAARFLSNTETMDAVKLWLETSFSKDARYARRIEKIDKLVH